MKSLYQFKKFYLINLIVLLIITLIGGSGSGSSGTDESELQGYPISSEVVTTRDRTVLPDPAPTGSPIFPYEVSKYSQYGYGNWQYGSGIDMGKQSHIMPGDYNVDSVTNTARLLNFFAITDIHISDKESPSQCVYYGYKGDNSSAYSAVKLYTTQVLDAAIQTITPFTKRSRLISAYLWAMTATTPSITN